LQIIAEGEGKRKGKKGAGGKSLIFNGKHLFGWEKRGHIDEGHAGGLDHHRGGRKGELRKTSVRKN